MTPPTLPRASALCTGGPDDSFLSHLRPLFARAQEVAILAAFVQQRGVTALERLVLDAAQRGARVRLVTGDYLHITQREALESLLGWSTHEPEAGSTYRAPEVRVVASTSLPTASKSFHPKAWIFLGPDAAFVGSSNISHAALYDGVEWNLRVDRDRDPGAFARVLQAFERTWAMARPLDADFLRGYRDAVRQHNAPLPPGEADDPPTEPPPAPHALQSEALAALQRARMEGRARALVVMATGLGKTWLAAFDLAAYARSLGRAPRLLFVAHRDELLRQAAQTFGRMFPQAGRGFFAGTQAELDTDFVFASVQKLGQRRSLEELATRRFDYAVIDEAHHATAGSYRRVLGALRADFVLGLTATPDRLDGAEVQSLLDDHLAYRADLLAGIEAGLLAPFRYFGIADTVDYKPIPWRNGRFDPVALSKATQTEARMMKAWEAWQTHPAERTLVFCCTIEHTRYVRDWLRARGVRVAAVHSDEDSDERDAALARLARGELDAVCSVDLFNEGVDVPAIDRVVMLRPSESPVVFLQQLGRGLRRMADKAALTVLDFVGNHRVFLDRLLLLRGSDGPTGDVLLSPQWLRRLQHGNGLPPGCAIALDLASIDLITALQRRRDDDFVSRFRQILAARGTRPSAVEMYRLGHKAGLTKGWMAFLAREEQLTGAEDEAYRQAGGFLDALEKTGMRRSFKMVTLLALLEADALTRGLPLGELSQRSHDILLRSPELFRDLSDVKQLANPHAPGIGVWASYWRKNPIAAWLGEFRDGEEGAWFKLEGDRFVPTFRVHSAAVAEALAALTAELVAWRLADYRARSPSGSEPVARVLPLNRWVPVFEDCRIAAGWSEQGAGHEAPWPEAAMQLRDGEPDDVFVVRVSGHSMEGARSHIADGDWIVCRPAHGADAAAWESRVVLVAQGDEVAPRLTLKRLQRIPTGALMLHADNADVPSRPWTPQDRVLAVFLRTATREETDSLRPSVAGHGMPPAHG